MAISNKFITNNKIGSFKKKININKLLLFQSIF